MMDILCTVYAVAVMKRISEFITEKYYGCEIFHPSQTHHSCLMLTRNEHIDMYFEEALENVMRMESQLMSRRNWKREIFLLTENESF